MSTNNTDDQFDFQEEMFQLDGVKPLKQSDTVFHGSSESDLLAKKLKRQAIEKALGSYQNSLTTEPVQPIEPDDVIAFKKDGVQEGVFKNLRLGKYEINRTLSLQGMKFKEVHEKVFHFIVDNYKHGNRALLIKHGMGVHSKPHPGFYKSYINAWLRTLPEVLAFHTAIKQHGGYGAVYVLLKKNEQLKLDNREKHRSRQA